MKIAQLSEVITHLLEIRSLLTTQNDQSRSQMNQLISLAERESYIPIINDVPKTPKLPEEHVAGARLPSFSRHRPTVKHNKSYDESGVHPLMRSKSHVNLPSLGYDEQYRQNYK